MKFRGFTGPAYRMDSLPISAQECINLFPEKQENPYTDQDWILRPTPGYKQVLEVIAEGLPEGSYTRAFERTSKGLGSSPETNGSMIAVCGPDVFWIKTDYTYEKLGSISNLNSRVIMVDDGFGLSIVDGINIYRLNLETKVLSQVVFDLSNPTYVDFLGGYTLLIGQDKNLPQNTFFWSGLYDNSSFDALDYASAEISQDPITAMIVAGNYLMLFGPSSYELWTATGDKDLPFARAYASTGSIGIHAPQSLTKIGDAVFFLGATNQGSVTAYGGVGTELKRISTLALENEWSQFDVTDCTTWTYSKFGHQFVIFNFDKMNKTYQYDFSENAWSQIASRDAMTNTQNRWEPNYGLQIGDTILVGDRFSTKFYELDLKYKTENGRTILRRRVTSHVKAEKKPMMVDSVRIDMDTGQGMTNELGRYTEAGEIMFKYSGDYGRTYSSEVRQSFGATGEYLVTPEFTRLGVHRVFTVDFSFSDNAGTSILGADIYMKIAGRTRQ